MLFDGFASRRLRHEEILCHRVADNCVWLVLLDRLTSVNNVEG